MALECLSYHATASGDDTVKLSREVVPSAEDYNLYSYNFHGIYTKVVTWDEWIKETC